MNKKIISSFTLLLTAVIWGFAFVAQVEGVKYIGTLTYNGIRFLIGAAVMIPLFFIFTKKKPDRKLLETSVVRGAVTGIILFAAATLQQYAITFSPDGNSMKAGFITGLYTIMVPIAGLIILKKKTGILTWVGAVLAVVGLYLLCAAGGAQLHFTDILLFLSVPMWTAHILYIDASAEKVNVFIFSCVQYAVCGAISLTGAFIFEMSSFTVENIGGAMIPILYGGLLSVGVAYTLQFIGQKNADPTVAAIIMSTESMFGAIGNLLLLDVSMTPVQYVGCGLIFSGIIVAQIVIKKRKKET